MMVSPLLAQPGAASAAVAPAASPASPAPAPEPKPAAAAPAGPPPKQTMLGMPMGLGAAHAAPQSEAKQTVFGVSESASTGDAPTPAATPVPAEKPKIAAASNRTMLGVAPVGAPAANKPAISAQTKQTMLGAAPPAALAAPASPTASAGSASVRPRSFTPVGPDPSAAIEDTDEPVVTPGRSGRGLMIGIGLLVLAIVAGGLFVWLGSRGPKLNVRVIASSTGDALEIDVPGSPPGAKVRFAGAERPLTAGRAAFPLAADGLAIGDNQLAIDVVHPNGSVESATVRLAVNYRVRADIAALSENPPAVEVVVDAVAGSKVTVDGAPIALDARGHAAKRYPVPPQTGATFQLTVPYRIESPDAPAVDGKVELSLPVVSMQIDRPGPEVTTDQQLLEIAGEVEPGAQVFVESLQIEVKDGRFLHRARLAEPGDYVLPVMARAQGKAPRLMELRVHRVADMTLAAASFQADRALTYARISQNPVIYKGQKVAFDGRVYNVEVQGGRSVLQMLVRDCPGAERCPLWVEYPQATDATVDTWVRVLGEISGEQQFRSKQGLVQTVPSVQAQYVLRLAR